MNRNVGLKPGGPLKRRTELKQTKPLPKVSKKRAKENRERAAMADRRFPGRDAMCVVPRCGQRADDFHEPLTRARLGSITDPDNTEPVCRKHNSELTEEPQWGYDLHLLVHSWDERKPAEVAAARRKALAEAYADLMWEAS